MAIKGKLKFLWTGARAVNTSHGPLWQLSENDPAWATNTHQELNYSTTETYVKILVRDYIIFKNLNGVTQHSIGTCITPTNGYQSHFPPPLFHYDSISTMHSNLFLNGSNDQNIPLCSFVVIWSTCATLPLDLLKKFSIIIGWTCSDISERRDDPYPPW